MANEDKNESTQDTVVEREVSITNITDMMDVNAELMNEISNDSRLSAIEKMKGFSSGVRNQCMLSRDQQARITMLARLGMKTNNLTKSLTFQVGE